MEKNFPPAGLGLVFDECGCCGHLHRPDWHGDCRDDSERFSFDELDEHYGENAYGWRDLGEQAEGL